MSSNKLQIHEVKIDKLVLGGQGIGTLLSGKKALVWGVLPGEKVEFKATKNRSDYVEGIVTQIIEKSGQRIDPRDPEYLSTSPWQIMKYDAENEHKKEILLEAMSRAKVNYPFPIDFITPKDEWGYRNKMEYSFYGDELGLHLALFNRGTHNKQIISGSSIARPEINKIAIKICVILNKHNIRAGDLKSIILRCNSEGEVVVAIFTRNHKFPKISELAEVCKGVVTVYSNPRSPASVRTEDLYTFGDISLSESILGKQISYDVFSFFQVNLPIFVSALDQINKVVANSTAIDFYSGVGAIGLSLKKTDMLIESDKNNIFWAEKNAKGTQTKVVHASSEKALQCIDTQHVLIVDPPRTGLHIDLVDKILETKPPKIIYLSCNPSTQARDVNLLQKGYKVEKITGYNFFPRTPHIESLAVLVRQ